MELEIKNVIKRYGNKAALDNFEFSFKEGVYGLLGPNGAGKSTLMRIITQNVRPTSGEVSLDGQNTFRMKEAYRRLIGYMPQQQAVYPFYTGRQFLNYMGLLKGEDKKTLKEKIEYYAGKVNLLDVIDDRLGTYSGGMKQRILIAQTFLGESKILIFDEPTAGLDPKERIHIRQLIHENSKDKIIIVATHVVQDIEDIADHIVFLKAGRVVRSGSPDGLIRELEGRISEKNKNNSASHIGMDNKYSLEDVYMDVFGM